MREEDQGSHVSRVSHLSRGVPALWTSTSLRAEERLEQISSLLTQERARLVGRLFHAKLSRWLDLWIPVLVAACVLLGIATFYVVQFVHAQENLEWHVGADSAESFPTPDVFMCNSVPLDFSASGCFLNQDASVSHSLSCADTGGFKPFLLRLPEGEPLHCALVQFSAMSAQLGVAKRLSTSGEYRLEVLEMCSSSANGTFLEANLFVPRPGADLASCADTVTQASLTAQNAVEINQAITSFLDCIAVDPDRISSLNQPGNVKYTVRLYPSQYIFFGDTGQGLWDLDPRTVVSFSLDKPQCWASVVYYPSNQYLVYRQVRPVSVLELLVNLAVSVSVSLSSLTASRLLCAWVLGLLGKRAARRDPAGVFHRQQQQQQQRRRKVEASRKAAAANGKWWVPAEDGGEGSEESQLLQGLLLQNGATEMQRVGVEGATTTVVPTTGGRASGGF